MTEHAKISPASIEPGNLIQFPGTNTNRVIQSQHSPSAPEATRINAEPFAKFMQATVQMPNNAVMQPVSKDLLDARLEAIEARMDTRVARIEGKIDLLTSTVATLAANQASLQQSVADAAKNSQTDAKSMKNTIIATGISTALAIVLGVAAFNATVLSNMVASFESGKNTAAMQASSEKVITEATKALEAATAKAQAITQQTNSTVAPQ